MAGARTSWMLLSPADRCWRLGDRGAFCSVNRYRRCRPTQARPNPDDAATGLFCKGTRRDPDSHLVYQPLTEVIGAYEMRHGIVDRLRPTSPTFRNVASRCAHLNPSGVEFIANSLPSESRESAERVQATPGGVGIAQEPVKVDGTSGGDDVDESSVSTPPHCLPPLGEVPAAISDGMLRHVHVRFPLLSRG